MDKLHIPCLPRLKFIHWAKADFVAKTVAITTTYSDGGCHVCNVSMAGWDANQGARAQRGRDKGGEYSDYVNQKRQLATSKIKGTQGWTKRDLHHAHQQVSHSCIAWENGECLVGDEEDEGCQKTRRYQEMATACHCASVWADGWWCASSFCPSNNPNHQFLFLRCQVSRIAVSEYNLRMPDCNPGIKWIAYGIQAHPIISLMPALHQQYHTPSKCLSMPCWNHVWTHEDWEYKCGGVLEPYLSSVGYDRKKIYMFKYWWRVQQSDQSTFLLFIIFF